MDYQEWLEELEEEIWVRLGAKLEEFDDVNFEDFYESGYSYTQIVEKLYDEEEDDEKLEDEDIIGEDY